MDIITLDAETLYDQDYSLSKISTEEYIRDPRFEIIGLSLKVNDGETVWVSGTRAQVGDFLAQYDWKRSALLAHNTLFDGAILSWVFGIKPRLLLDTLSMARALHGPDAPASLAKLVQRYKLGAKGTEVINAKGKRRRDFTDEELARYGDYCVNDTELTYKLFKIMRAGFPADEIRLIDLTLRMFTEPVLELDKPLLLDHYSSVLEHKEKLLAKIPLDKKFLMSNEKFAKVLRMLGVTPPMKTSPRTGKQTYAFAKSDEGFKELQEHPDLRVQTLVAARLGVKSTLEETRTERFIAIAERGNFPVPLKYYAAHTGRWGGCLSASTEVIVYRDGGGVLHVPITEVQLDDLVWDGVEFVEHEGVVLSGFDSVITWDGVTGTQDHAVFTDAGEISLREAMQGAHPIQTGGSPTQDAVDRARKHMESDEGTATVPMLLRD